MCTTSIIKYAHVPLPYTLMITYNMSVCALASRPGTGPVRGTTLSSSMPMSGMRPQPSGAAKRSPLPQRANSAAAQRTASLSPGRAKSSPQRASPGASRQQQQQPQRAAGQGMKRFTSPAQPKPAPRTPRGGAGNGGANRASVEFSGKYVV